MLAKEIKPGDKSLERALETVRTNSDEARKFATDPEAYLKGKGISTDGLKFGVTHGELSEEQLDTVAGGITICGSVGAVVCASVGN